MAVSDESVSVVVDHDEDDDIDKIYGRKGAVN